MNFLFGLYIFDTIIRELLERLRLVSRFDELAFAFADSLRDGELANQTFAFAVLQVL